MLKTTNQQLERPSAQQYAAMDKLPVVVVLDNVRSANNVGSFFRTCDAFGVKQLVLGGITATPPSRDIHKTALGAEMSVQWSHTQDLIASLSQIKQQGYTIVVVEQVQGAVMLQEWMVDKGAKYALVFGNEVDGVAQEIVDMADMALEIPQVGTKHSLNVAVSGGAVMWHCFKGIKY